MSALRAPHHKVPMDLPCTPMKPLVSIVGRVYEVYLAYAIVARKDWADPTAIRADPPVTLCALQECGDVQALWTPLVDCLQKLCSFSLLFRKILEIAHGIHKFEVYTTGCSADIAEA